MVTFKYQIVKSYTFDSVFSLRWVDGFLALVQLFQPRQWLSIFAAWFGCLRRKPWMSIVSALADLRGAMEANDNAKNIPQLSDSVFNNMGNERIISQDDEKIGRNVSFKPQDTVIFAIFVCTLCNCLPENQPGGRYLTHATRFGSSSWLEDLGDLHVLVPLPERIWASSPPDRSGYSGPPQPQGF